MDVQALNMAVFDFVKAEIRFTFDGFRDNFHSLMGATGLSGTGHGQFHNAIDTIFAELATLERELR
jgi:hypothetical protein